MIEKPDASDLEAWEDVKYSVMIIAVLIGFVAVVVASFVGILWIFVGH